jgi:hypothetical protein
MPSHEKAFALKDLEMLAEHLEFLSNWVIDVLESYREDPEAVEDLPTIARSLIESGRAIMRVYSRLSGEGGEN